MFSNLSDKFSQVLRDLSGRGKISESNVREAMEQVRNALLEADVHYDVVQSFTKQVVDEAMGTKVLESLRPGQQMIKIVYDELVKLMGPVDSHMMYVQPGPTIVMMCGLQGSGKTTTCGKLAAYLKKRGKSVMLAAAYLQRPAAVQQLNTLADQVQADMPGSAPVLFYSEPDKVAEYGKAVGAAVKVCVNAVKAAREKKVDVLILDTAGRLHINDALMDELRQVNAAVNPHQIYLVIDAMTGQDAVNSAKAFNDQLELDGVILTKFDSDTRGGAALSVKHVTGKPLKFIGTGEKLDALEEFHPERIASRMLGMGDVVSLVERAQEQVSEEEAAALQQKMAEGKMTMDDFLAQLQKIRKMGSMKSVLGLLPGIGNQFANMDLDEKQIDRTQAIIQSMNKKERTDVELLDNSRRRRIARGSGTHTEEVSAIVKGFEAISEVTKQMSSMSTLTKLKSMAGMGPNLMDAAALRGLGRPGSAPDKSKPKFKERKRKSR
ncbi:MAG: signal recognition particle protein [Planctomycetota bacterium]|nr:signal recognition particle protein [Planctomycetota bacterium]